MTKKPRWIRSGLLLAACLLVLPAVGTRSAETGNAPVLAPPGLSAAMAEYRRALAEYEEAHATFAAAAEAYWRLIAQKRRLRAAKRAAHEPLALDDYVLAQ